jgi:hypothetical protein
MFGKNDTKIEAASSRGEAAEKAHTKDVGRLAEARKALEDVLAEICASDPDAAAFDKIVRRRVEAESRALAFEGREAAARKALEDARAELAELERARDGARLAEIRGEIRAAEEGATARAKEVAAEFCAVGAAQQERINEANALVHRLEGPNRNHHSDLIHIGATGAACSRSSRGCCEAKGADMAADWLGGMLTGGPIRFPPGMIAARVREAAAKGDGGRERCSWSRATATRTGRRSPR